MPCIERQAGDLDFHSAAGMTLNSPSNNPSSEASEANDGAVDPELLKLIGAGLALIFTLVTLQFQIGEWVNSVRDGVSSRTTTWQRWGDVFDWTWGYTLGIGLNILFVGFLFVIKESLGGVNRKLAMGMLVGFVVNTAFWCIGFVLDLIRIIKAFG